MLIKHCSRLGQKRDRRNMLIKEIESDKINWNHSFLFFVNFASVSTETDRVC